MNSSLLPYFRKTEPGQIFQDVLNTILEQRSKFQVFAQVFQAIAPVGFWATLANSTARLDPILILSAPKMVLGFLTQHVKEILEILKMAVMDVLEDLEEKETELLKPFWVSHPNQKSQLVLQLGMKEKSDLHLLVIGNSDKWTKMVCVFRRFFECIIMKPTKITYTT